MTDTIVALSSGRPPAAIGIVRVSGPSALAAVTALCGTLPAPRRAAVRPVRDEAGALLDRALVLVFPGPASATGEDLVELHCHGGRAVLAAVEAAVRRRPGVRAAAAGEFTRRAVLNGRVDLAQAEGLADLLDAESEGQRRAALAASEGRVSGAIRGWLDRLGGIAALIEAGLEFGEEGDVAAEGDTFARARTAAAALQADMGAMLAGPPVERVRDGVRVVLAGPPNAGKSTLLNLLAEREAAIVTATAGTTRDRIDVPVQRGGIAYLLTDTAGLRAADDPAEVIGVARATEAMAEADLLVWLGDAQPPRADALWLHARADLPERGVLPPGRVLAVSHHDANSIDQLWALVEERARELLPAIDAVPFKRHQRDMCAGAAVELSLDADPVLAAEQVRAAHGALAGLLGVNAPEAMLDALFGRFCIGK